ncbi:MAG: integrase domain-containing protein [Methylophilaceae bacterium]
MRKLNFDAKEANEKIGKSHGTKDNRLNTLNQLVTHLYANNIQHASLQDIRPKDIKSFIEAKKELGRRLRTLENLMAHIRSFLKQEGRHRLANDPMLTNSALGISGGSREGKKLPILPYAFESAVEIAKMKDIGVAACMVLSLVLGLRSLEAIRSWKSLKTWKKQLLAGEDELKVVYGTKGGRDRWVKVHDRDAVLKAVLFACDVAATRKGKLIDRPNLKTAINHFRRIARESGLKGNQSFHSLRYWFAVMALKSYLNAGFSHEEALVLTSHDLGHGDGRGQYIKHVYVQSFWNSMEQEFIYTEFKFFHPENTICEQIPLFS